MLKTDPSNRVMTIIIARLNGILCLTSQQPPPNLVIVPQNNVFCENMVTTPGTDSESDDLSCCICYEEVTSREVLRCRHPICIICSESLSKPECPVCRRRLEGPSVTPNVLSMIQRRIQNDRRRSSISKQLIIRLIQRASISLYAAYRYEFNLMFQHGLSVMHGQDPLEFNTNKKIKDRVCYEYVDLIIESYPNQFSLRESLFADISAFFTVLDIDM